MNQDTKESNDRIPKLSIVFSKDNNLRSVRLHEGLKYTELARLASVSPRTVTDIEKGKAPGTPETKHKICNGFNRNQQKTKDWNFEEIFPNDQKD